MVAKTTMVAQEPMVAQVAHGGSKTTLVTCYDYLTNGNGGTSSPWGHNKRK